MKKIIFLIISFLLCISNAYATNINNDLVKTFERTEEDIRVNKNFEINDNNIINVMMTPSVDSKDKIYDFANILKNKNINSINNFIKKHKMDLAIVTINEKEHSDTKLFGQDFYDYNDFGIDMKYYSGILLVLDTPKDAANGSNRVEIITTGNAILMYDDERINLILDAMMNSLYNKDFDQSVSIFIEESEKYAKEGMPSSADSYKFDKNGKLIKKFNPNFLLIGIISVIIMLIFMSILISKNKMVKTKHSANDYLENNTEIIKQDHFNRTYTSKVPIPKSSSSGGGISSGSSGSSHGGGGRSF